MSYFNIFHIIVLLLILSMFGLFTYLIILKEHRTKQAISLLVVNVAIMSCLAMVSMMLIDKYTKVAEIINLEGRRTLINETISYSGIIKNVGYGYINSCTINIELINTPEKRLEASNFENRGFFDIAYFQGTINAIHNFHSIGTIFIRYFLNFRRFLRKTTCNQTNYK